jgi:hypothetical protein
MEPRTRDNMKSHPQLYRLRRVELENGLFITMRVLLYLHPLLGNGLVKKLPRRQIHGKQSVAMSRNNRTNVYSSLLGNKQRANGLAKYLSRDLFSM